MGGLFMKIKAILRALFLAYLLSGGSLLLLALLVFKLDIGKGPVTAGILAIYVLKYLIKFAKISKVEYEENRLADIYSRNWC